MSRTRARLPSVLAVGGVLLVAALGAVVILTTPSPASAPATSAPVVPTRAAPPQPTVAPKPTAGAAVGKWTLRGSGDTNDFQITEGVYRLVWSMDVVAPMLDPASFSVSLTTKTPTPMSANLVDFTQSGVTGQVGSYGDNVPVGPLSGGTRGDPTPAGRYHFEVNTCDYCRWNLSLWPR